MIKPDRSFLISMAIFAILCAIVIYGKNEINLLPHPETDGEVVERAMYVPLGVSISAILSLIIYLGLKVARSIKRKMFLP